MITKLSPAKVNLYLSVLRKRADGYHDILTLMQRISIYDEMTFSRSRHGILVKCPDSPLPENDDNIVYRAARLILSYSPNQSGINIQIKKKIPIAAGLGGGSSNAATTLMAINEMLELDLSPDQLIDIGAQLGSDVPFFIYKKTAWATDTGTHFRPADNIPFLWFVLINPHLKVSTKMVYEKLNLRLTKGSINYSIPRLYTIHDVAEGLLNDLEKVTFDLYPGLRELKNLLIEHGALGALMSGSGPTVFGIFDEEEVAIRAEKALAKGEKWSVFRAFSI